MESIVASGSDFLVGPLSYEVMQDQASYVTTRRNSQIFASVPEAGPTSVKSVKWNIADPNGFIDLSTLCFSFTVQEKGGAAALQPLTSIPHNYFSRMIVRCSSSLVEDVQLLGRTEEMFSRFLSKEKKANLATMGNGMVGDDPQIPRPIPLNGTKVWCGDLLQADF